MCNVSSDIRFKTKILNSSLCDYSDAYILVIGRITITEGHDDATKRASKRNKGVMFKNCVPFIKCKTEKNNAEINNAKDTDIVIPMYNLIGYSDNYSKTSAGLWQYYRVETEDNLTDSE